MTDQNLRARNAATVAELVAATPADRAELVERLIVANLGVARAVARRYSRGSELGADLEQVACLALVRAARQYDPERGEFLAYAIPYMAGEVKRYFRDSAWMIRPPRPVQDRHRTVEQRADHVAEGVVVETCFRPRSLDMPSPGDVRPMGDTLAAEGDRSWEEAEARLLLAPHLRALTPRARRILHLRFVEDRTQEEIGAELGIHQVQVSRLLAQHLRELREMLVDAA